MVISDMVVQQNVDGRELSVNEAAHLLSLRPRSVLRLIRDGELPARKEFGRWRILRSDVEVRRELGSHGGRRYSPAQAWGLITIASGGQAPWLDRVSRWRIERQLDARPFDMLRPGLTGRGRSHRYAAHPDSITRLRRMTGVMLSGLPGAVASGAGVVASSEHFEAYLPESHLVEAVRKNHLREDLEGSVNLRPVAAEALPGPWPEVAPRLAIALDLLESHDPRARRVGRDLLAETEGRWRSR
jgi:excisionase family DNA binding protein